MTSGCADATSSAVVVLPGAPMNSPPAASTSSATQGCDAMIGFPHSSQKTLGLDADRGALANRLDFDFAWPLITRLTAFPCAHDACNRSHVGVDVGQPARSQPEKSHARLQDCGHRFQLIGNRRQHQVGTSRENLFRLRGPGIGDNQARAVRNLGADVRAIFGASHQAIQQAQIAQRDRGAGLERDDALRSVIWCSRLFDYTERGPMTGKPGAVSYW